MLAQNERSVINAALPQTQPSDHNIRSGLSSSPSISLSNSASPNYPNVQLIEQQVSHLDQTSVSGGYAAAIPVSATMDNSSPWGEGRDLEYWLPDSLNTQTSFFGLSGNSIHVKTALPPIVDVDACDTSLNIQTDNPMSGIPLRQSSGRSESLWPSYINESSLIPWIDVYFDRLHPTLPVLNRSSIFIRILSQEHRRNSQFGAMLLAVGAFSLTQPIEISERPTASSRADQARFMMNESTKMRSSSDFGEQPTLEAVLTSFFLFGCLFGTNQHNAARLRLREAIDLALMLGLNDPNSYNRLSSEEKGQWLRTYLVLSVTERYVTMNQMEMRDSPKSQCC